MPAKRPEPDDPARPADMISRRFGRRLRQLRSERNWSLETLASRSGVSRSMISQIEREQANPTLAVTLRTLSPLNLEKDVELYELQLEPAGALRSAPHFAGTREYLTVVKGSIRVESGDDSDSLHTGDSANYRADIPHAIINDGPHQALAILVVIYR